MGRVVFGEWLRCWRLGQDPRQTQQDLARALGYDVTYVGKLERGERLPTRQVLARVGQVTGEDLGRFGATGPGDVGRPALPLPSTKLVGRGPDLAAIRGLFAGGARCVTLVGSPGIGKTRLSVEVARRMDSRLAGGSWFVSLIGVPDGDSVGSHLVGELGLGPSPGGDPAEGLAAWFASQSALLVLDNFEHVLSARSIVSDLLGKARNLSILVTSREPLGILWEHVWRVSPLALPPSERTDPGSVSSAPAVELFTSRARMVAPDFRLSAANSSAVTEACTLLDGVPLAIVIAAGATRSLDASSISARLRRGLGVPGAEIADLPHHHASLDRAIAWSWNLLAEEDRDALADLSVFAGGVTAEAAGKVVSAIVEVGVGDEAPSEAIELLDRLARKSLLEARPDAQSGPRFEMLATVRDFALARLRQSGRHPELWRRYGAYYRRLAARSCSGLTGDGQLRWLAVTTDERVNLEAAFGWALAEEPDAALAMAADLWRYFLIRDPRAGRRWLDASLKAVAAATDDRARALAASAALAWVTGDLDTARSQLDSALGLATELDLDDVVGLVRLNQAALAEQEGRFEDAELCFKLALDAYDALDDPRGRGCALVGLGVLCRARGDVTAAYGFWLDALGLFRVAGDRFLEALALSNVAWAALHEDRLEEAESWYEQCRSIEIALGDARGLANTAAGRGRIAARAGEHRRAWELTAEALASFQRLGDHRRAAETLLDLAGIAGCTGEARLAATLLGVADALWSRVGGARRDDDLATEAEAVERIASVLGADGLDRVRQAGRSVSLDEAVAAVAERGQRGDLPAGTPMGQGGSRPQQHGQRGQRGDR